MRPHTTLNRPRAMPSTRLGAIAACLLGLAGCATRPTDPAARADDERTNDPYQPANRFFYRVDNTLDAYTLKPVTQAYVWLVPLPGRTGLHNVLTNLSTGPRFFNDVFEGKPRRAGDTFMRLLINTTVGIGGILDVASGWGYPFHDSDGGLTLAVWGVPQGPYLFLPFLGPSTARDSTGFGLDVALSPFTYVPRGYGLLTLNTVRYGVGVVDARSEVLGDLDQIKRNALDPYATIRSLYRQHRNAEVQAVRDDHRMTVPDWYSH